MNSAPNRTDVARNVALVRQSIAEAAGAAGRAETEITLIAVSKTVPTEHILEAVRAGVTHFGENRVQEAMQRFAPRTANHTQEGLVSREGITLHMIGTLQRNKAAAAAAFFDSVQSVDRPELARALEKAAQASNAGSGDNAGSMALPVLLEVNVTGEPSKSGAPPEQVRNLAETVAACPHLLCSGLMTVARMGADEKELRQTFAELRRLRDTLQGEYPQIVHLSMGMSGDYRAAIQEGATMVRIGRAIFGERL